MASAPVSSPAQFEIVKEVAKPAAPLGFWKIALAVMIGNIMAAMAIGVFYALAIAR